VTKPAHHRGAYVLLGALLAVDVAVFMLQKAASRTDAAGAGEVLMHAATSPMLWIAVALAPAQLWLWTKILRHSDIGWAYALTSFAYPLTMLAASLLLRERYGLQVWMGAFLITAGVVVLGPQHKSSTAETSTPEDQVGPPA
jgi:Kef-type K+ transport system membrane component KefB